MFLKSFILSVTKVNLWVRAVTPRIRSNSSCKGVPFFLNLTLISAYLSTEPIIGIIESPPTNLSTALWDCFGLALFSAPNLSSNTVNSDMKQFEIPFSRIISSSLSFPRRKKIKIFNLLFNIKKSSVERGQHAKDYDNFKHTLYYFFTGS